MIALSFHPIANIFPLLDGEEFASLSEDVKSNGLREPIIVYEGMILDGRNRYRACLDAGVEPHLEVYAGDNPVGLVVSLNLRRRHLDESQRAMVAAKLANLDHGGNRKSPIGDLKTAPVTQDAAAQMLNVGKRSVERAVEVRDRAIPELAETVERGEVSVSAAATVSKLPEEEQREIVNAGPKAVRDAARDIRETGIVNRTSFTGNNQWFTPAEHIERARLVLGSIELDPATHEIAQQTVRANQFYTEEDDGLSREWHGSVWLNPPYAQPEIGYFVDKIVEETSSGRVRKAIMLTHNYTDTAWFQKAAGACSAICFTRGRIRFVSPTGELAAPTQGQAFFYFGDEVDLFHRHFREAGLVVEVRK